MEVPKYFDCVGGPSEPIIGNHTIDLQRKKNLHLQDIKSSLKHAYF